MAIGTSLPQVRLKTLSRPQPAGWGGDGSSRLIRTDFLDFRRGLEDEGRRCRKAWQQRRRGIEDWPSD
jgi:hypothetical protein